MPDEKPTLLLPCLRCGSEIHVHGGTPFDRMKPEDGITLFHWFCTECGISCRHGFDTELEVIQDANRRPLPAPDRGETPDTLPPRLRTPKRYGLNREWVAESVYRELLEKFDSRPSPPPPSALPGEVERVARIICEWYGYDPDAFEPGCIPGTDEADGYRPEKANEPQHFRWRDFAGKAEALLAALASHLRSVPVAPGEVYAIEVRGDRDDDFHCALEVGISEIEASKTDILEAAKRKLENLFGKGFKWRYIVRRRAIRSVPVRQEGVEDA